MVAGTIDEVSWPEATRMRRAILVADLVDSVRLIGQNENDVVERWRHFVADVRTRLLPRFGGRMVKSLGDGLLLAFDSVHSAVAVAMDLHASIRQRNAERDTSQWLHLRIGIHEAEILVDELDVYGDGVNLAARLCGLGGPDETVISAMARDALVADLDVDIEDLGDCWLKGFAEPQRAYRAGPVGSHAVMWSPLTGGGIDRVSIAVIPFATRSEGGTAGVLGEVIADDLIAQLSHEHRLHVVSRLSTTVFRQREADLQTLVSLLGIHYVVHGSCFVDGDRVRLRAQLVDGHSAAVLWADAVDGSVAGVLGGDSPLVEKLHQQVCHALLGAEIQRAITLPLPSLQSYTILLGAIAMMHRLSPRDFERAREMLAYLIERHPLATAPRAWLGKWHVMRVAQGWSPDPLADAQQARSVVAKALDIDPQHALALAIDGLICAYINKDLTTAALRYEAAVAVNPSESLAWLFQSALHSYGNRGEQAVDCAMRAQRLSPLDPMRYYYDNFTSMAKLSAGDYAGAIDYGRRSLRANRTHGSTLRILAIAQALAGDLDLARASIADLLRLEPNFTVSAYLDRYPGAGSPHVATYVEALRLAGLPD